MMDALLLALILTLILDQGSGTQQVVARFGSCFAEDDTIPRGMIAGLGIMITVNAIVAAALGALVAAILAPNARLLFFAMALGMGGLGLSLAALRPARSATNPSITGWRTLLSFALRRAGENGAFAVAGVTAFTDAPILAAGGAMAGGWVALILPLSLGIKMLDHWAMRSMQLAAGLGLFCTGIGCAVTALRLI